MKIIAILILMLVLLSLLAGCTTTAAQPREPIVIERTDIIPIAFDIPEVRLPGESSIRPMNIIPICDDRVVLYVYFAYKSGGIWGTRDKDIVDKYCGCAE